MGWNNWTPKKSSTLCSSHFTIDSIDYGDQRARLRKGAVPTIFGSPVNDDKLLDTEQTFHVDEQTPSSSSSDLRAAVLLPSFEVRELLSSPAILTEKLSSSPTATQTLSALPKVEITPRTDECSRRRSLQHDHHYVDTPETLLKKLNAARTRISKIQSERKVLKQKLKRSKITIQTMKTVIKELRQQKIVSNTGLYSQSELKSFETRPAHLFTRKTENKTKSKPSQKKLPSTKLL